MRGVPRYADLIISSIGEISRECVFKSPLGHQLIMVWPVNLLLGSIEPPVKPQVRGIEVNSV